MPQFNNKNLTDFTGGYNCVDSELTMKDRYLTKALNCELGYDSTLKKRNGFKLIFNVWEYLDDGEFIQEIFYFELHAILYTNKGRIFALDDENNLSVIWDEEIATERGGLWNHPEEKCWGTVGKDLFILSNGFDKPLQIDFHNVGGKIVQYLFNPATGSNADVPAFAKAVMVNHYLCSFCFTTTETDVETGEKIIAPDTKIYISAKDAMGYYFPQGGDPAAYREAEVLGCAEINIADIVPVNNQKIVDIAAYRNQLCVFTDYSLVMITLDEYTETSGPDLEDPSQTTTYDHHTPKTDTVVDNAGAAITGSALLCYDDIVFVSTNGINSVKRNAISSNFMPESLSYKMLPFIKKNFSRIIEQGYANSFVDRQKFVYYIKFPDHQMLCMSFHRNLPEQAFYIWTNIRYLSFCNNIYGRILATDGNGVFIYADDSEGIAYDTYIDDVTGTPEQENVQFEVETPWIMYGSLNNIKHMQYIKVISDGTAKFTLSASFDLLEEQELKIDLLGGSEKGYGSSNPYYGGGIITSKQGLIEFSQQFMYNKFKIVSNDEKPLRISAISVSYTQGGIRR